MDYNLQKKYNKLVEIIKGYGKVAIAFSSGVDSTFLLAASLEALESRHETTGAENAGNADKTGAEAFGSVLALTARIFSAPAREKDEAETFCRDLGVRHIMLDIDELAVSGFAENPPDRCYICKKALFTEMKNVAHEQGFEILAEGSNTDDDGDYRPGMKAIEELGIASPLKEAGLSKEDIRALSREMELPTWNKPSMACLSSRFAYGEMITKEKLAMVDRAEEFLSDMDFSQVRVRIHGEDVARIEVAPEMLEELMRRRGEITRALKDIGFRYVTCDLDGYRTGSMNEALDDRR